MFMQSLILIASAYLIGAIPTAYIVGQSHGINLRLVGDGNLGSRNAFKVLGWRAGILVGLVDLSKGALATWLAVANSENPLIPYLAALAAALGHDFSIYIRFQGGQGMASNLGSLFILQPRETILCLGTFVVLYLLFRNWDLGWTIGMGGMVAAGWYWGRPTWELWMLVILLISIGLKKLLDLPLAQRIRQSHP